MKLRHSLCFQFDRFNRASYQYDATGNRTGKTSNAVTQLYSYPPTSHRLAQVDNRAYSLDAAGNTTSDGNNQYTYNALGRMVSSTNAQGSHHLPVQRPRPAH